MMDIGRALMELRKQRRAHSGCVPHVLLPVLVRSLGQSCRGVLKAVQVMRSSPRWLD